MKPSIGIVHQDTDGAYGIAFPDAPGCFAASDALDDIFAEAGEALGLRFETAIAERIAVPKVRELSDLRSDLDGAASFGDAAPVIAVAPPMLRRPEAA